MSVATPVFPFARSRIGLLSTYPPKLCGLATFTAALAAALEVLGHDVEVVTVEDAEPTTARAEERVVGVLRNGSGASVAHAASLLSRYDAVIIQHEYGIYGGPDGDEILDLLGALTVPSVVVLHTVPSSPTAGQRQVLETIGERAATLVVMSETARSRLLTGYQVSPEHVVTIPHGAVRPFTPPQAPAPGQSLTLLTWGLLGPGKGVEHVIDALALLGSTGRRLRYTVAGVTHPKVYAREGDAYRRSLVERTWSSGVANLVTFDDTYRDVPSLVDFVSAASVVVLPYDSRDQVTSGVLVDALAAGTPVIATAFPHAIELLSGGAGIVVPHEDPEALADAIRLVWSSPHVLDRMRTLTRRVATTLAWPAVAERYAGLVRDAGQLTLGLAT